MKKSDPAITKTTSTLVTIAAEKVRILNREMSMSGSASVRWRRTNT